LKPTKRPTKIKSHEKNRLGPSGLADETGPNKIIVDIPMSDSGPVDYCSPAQISLYSMLPTRPYRAYVEVTSRTTSVCAYESFSISTNSITFSPAETNDARGSRCDWRLGADPAIGDARKRRFAVTPTSSGYNATASHNALATTRLD
jgi:hypothetical protein